MCGTWLTWLINQHKNFPHYEMNHKNYLNDIGQSTILDVGCYGADWYIYDPEETELFGTLIKGDMTKKNNKLGINKVNKEIANFDFKDNRIVRRQQIRNKSFTKDCVKPLPNHGMFKKVKDTIVDEVLLKKAMDDMAPDKIIVPYFNSSNLTIVKRWAIYRDYHGRTLKDAPQDEVAHWVRVWKEHGEYLLQENPYGDNVHTVDIEKLTTGDKDEYLKLCEAIGEEPIGSIQDHISWYRMKLLQVAEHFDGIKLTNIEKV